MEWAESVDLSLGKAKMHRGLNDQIMVELKSLHNRGLPRLGGNRHTIRVQLNNGKRVNFADANVHFDTSLSREVWKTHGLYRWDQNSRAYFIPTLALMRAFFCQPEVLAEIFRPQALERMAVLNDANNSSSPMVQLLMAVPSLKTGRPRNKLHLLLKWMLSHQSARHMAGSVHRYALQGDINLSLPLAAAYIEVAGITKENSFFVTRCRVMSLTPEEGAINNGELSSRIVISEFRGHGYDVPRHRNGSFELNNQEWEHIRALPTIQGSHRIKLSRRHMIDMILKKLANETAWKNISPKVGTIDSAISLHRELQRSGELERVLNYLHSSRSLTRS